MDLLDFEGEELYFDEPLPPAVDQLLQEAAINYTEGTAELPLLQAYFLAPEHLMVLVSLYRFFFYQHRYEETLIVAERALMICAPRLHFPSDWRQLHPEQLTADLSTTLVRFYLLVLKGAAYIHLRLGHLEEGKQRLEKVLSLDTEDRLGASILLQTLQDHAGA